MARRSEVLWWKGLKEKDLLEMSFILAQKALSAWDSFDHATVVECELKSLPENALKEIEASVKGFHNSQKLNEHFTSFITPVIQIRDGYLKYPYEVKLAFLSVFHILNGILATNVTSARQAFFHSITRATDAIRIARILTSEEVSMLTHKYYLLSQNG